MLELLMFSIVLEEVQDASLLGSVSIALFKTYVTCTCSCAQQNADLRSLLHYNYRDHFLLGCFEVFLSAACAVACGRLAVRF